ncbi:MAG: SDR family oxidoreductase [Thermomicrobiales bacterium]
MEIRLDGQRALVTGAATGIGRGIAVALANAGAEVAINVRGDSSRGQETADLLRASGKEPLIVQGDVGDPEQVAAMFARLDDAWGSIDILVNNAGHGSSGKPVHANSWEEWQRVMRSNLDGPFLCSREVAQRLLARGAGGRIINITSVHEEACNVPGDGPYCVSKGALRNLTRAMALELAPHGITVNAVAPGMILTPMNRRAMDDAAYLAEAEAQIPVRRVGLPEDIAAMVVFLCSAHASYCTGGTYLVDGGWMLTWPPV